MDRLDGVCRRVSNAGLGIIMAHSDVDGPANCVRWGRSGAYFACLYIFFICWIAGRYGKQAAIDGADPDGVGAPGFGTWIADSFREDRIMAHLSADCTTGDSAIIRLAGPAGFGA